MSNKTVTVHTDAAPQAIGPYSQATVNAGWVFVSGQIPLDPTTGDLVAGDFAQQAKQHRRRAEGGRVRPHQRREGNRLSDGPDPFRRV